MNIIFSVREHKSKINEAEYPGPFVVVIVVVVVVCMCVWVCFNEINSLNEKTLKQIIK